MQPSRRPRVAVRTVARVVSRLSLVAVLAPIAVGAASDAPSEPLVDEPPAASAICPAIEEDYELCAQDPWSGNCRDFVAAAGALRDLYLYRLQHELATANELETTVFWSCGKHRLPALAKLLARIDSPEARTLVASEPYRSAHAAAGAEPAPRPLGLPPGAPVDCDAAATDADRASCERRELDAVKTRHETLLAACEKALPAPQRDELAAQERSFRAMVDGECVEPPCLAAAIRRRDDEIGRAFPQCGKDGGADVAGLRVPQAKTGMLPARWTPPDGASRPVPFTFESRSATRGTLSTTLGDGGETFHGPYVRLEKSTKDELVTEVFDGFSSPEWQTWQHDPDGEWTSTGASFGEFARFYTGRVVATLAGDRGHSMRCQLRLKEPQSGLSGGGKGGCQVSRGGRVTLDF